MSSKIEKLSHARIQCTIEIPEEERVKAEERALQKFATHVRIDGFREGKAPIHMVRERVPKDELTKETVHQSLPKVLPQALEESKAEPIIAPKVAILKESPLTLAITFVGRPEVKVAKAEKIAIEKKEIPSVTAQDIDNFLAKILGPEGKETSVTRAAKNGDTVTLDLAVTVGGAEVAELKEEKMQTVLGSSEDLLPGVAAALVGMKSGESKTIDIALGEDLEQRDARGKKAKAAITLQKVSEVQLPEITSEFLKSRFGTDKSPEAFRKDIEEMIARQRTQGERHRREEAFFDAVRDATKVEIAPELLHIEIEELMHNLDHRLKEQQITVDDWLKSTGKEWKDVVKDMEDIATKRLILRFGLEEVLKARDITATDEELQETLERLSHEQPESSEESLRSQASWMKRVQKLLESATA